MGQDDTPSNNNLRIDESVRIKQREWSHLLEIEELVVPSLPPCPLSTPDQLFLASIWLKDAVKGRNVDFPQNSFQLQCYYITRSHNFLIFYSIICFVHLLFPFLEQPYCAWETHGSRNYAYSNPPFDPRYLSPHTASILSFFCLLVYLAEIIMRLSVNFHHRSRRALDFWTKVRLVLVVVMIIDSLYAMSAYTPQTLRALVPMVYITRRKSLRQMTSGLFLAVSKCASVFILLFCIILAWSYLGSMIFGQIELEVSGRFGSLLKSFLTTLESYSCRGYIIFAVDPLFEANPGTATYFVTLSIFADILCSALVIATGTRQYQQYAARIFKKELLNRKQSMLAVFGVLYHCSKEREDVTNRQTDVRGSQPSISESVSTEFDPTVTNSKRLSVFNPLVDLKDKTQYISKQIWLDFCTQLSGRYEMSSELAAMLYETEVLPGEKGLSREGLFNLAALLDGHIKIEGALPTESDVSMTDEGIGRDDAGQVEAFTPRAVSIADFARGTSRATEDSGILLSEMKGASKASPEITNKPSELSRLSIWVKIQSQLRLAKVHYCHTCLGIMRASLTLSFHLPLLSDGFNQICYFEYAVFIARLLLIFQLIFLAKSPGSMSWISFGWVLEIFFWWEMFVRLGASAGWSVHYYTRLIGINVITLSLMISIGTEHTSPLSGKLVALICFQWIRLIRVFLPFNASKALRTLLPLLFRVLFLVFTVIYFFANIGYYRFCNSFSVEQANEVDDWAERWVPYEKQLNFNTMTQTMYTLFIVAILGSWSFVMRAAMLSEAAPAAIYFYSYRLVMTLVVLPILTSFIIQAYNARSARLDEMEQERKKVLESSRGSAASVSVAGGSMSGAGAVLNSLHNEGQTQRGTQGSEASVSTVDTTSSISNSQSTTFISRVEETENSMISFWSGSGNENYSAAAATQKPVRRSSVILSPDGVPVLLTPEELVLKLTAAMNSLEIYKTSSDSLMRENQELKMRLKEIQDVLEFEDSPEKDYT